MCGVYVCMRVCCKCVHMQSCVLHVCSVCVQNRKRQLLQAFKCVYLYTAVYVHAHTHKMPLRLQENSIVQGYYFINDHMFASSAPDTV